MKKFDHCNILKVFDVIEHKETTNIILEYMELGSLSDFIK